MLSNSYRYETDERRILTDLRDDCYLSIAFNTSAAIAYKKCYIRLTQYRIDEFIKINDITIFSFTRYEDDNSNLVRLNPIIKTKSLLKFNKSSTNTYKIFVKLFLYAFSPIIALFLYRKLKIFNFHIVHINMNMSSLYFLFWKVISCFNKKTKYVETYHTNWHLLKFYNKIIFPFICIRPCISSSIRHWFIWV